MKIDRESSGKFFDGTPGKSWDDYAARLKNTAAGEVDDRGYSLADKYDGVAEKERRRPERPRLAPHCRPPPRICAKQKQHKEDDAGRHTPF